jgi:murein DD-endopeptidase MepM/ murein hydrolase activator NlpD
MKARSVPHAVHVFVLWLGLAALGSPQTPPPVEPLLRAVDLDIGESQEVRLSDGRTLTVELRGLEETTDDVNGAVRQAQVRVAVEGSEIELVSGPYRLPVVFGVVQLDCPVTRGYLKKADSNPWALDKDARIRLWPKGSPWIAPGTFAYPARQRWFASLSQMSNEPVYVDGGDTPGKETIYYHYGLDIGGCEGMVDVVAATDGLVVSSGNERLAGYEDTPASPRYDVVYVRDGRGWYYRYSHLKTIEPEIRPGARVRMGQKIGLLGKEGGSGGWSHLHFDITAPQPSGRYGIQEGYAFLWQAYRERYEPEVVAVARPHHLIWSGQSVELDGSRSYGRGLSYLWTFGDGTTANGAKVERAYAEPGSFAEILKVTDADGNVDYDFAVVQVIDRQHPHRLPPTIHAAYAPTWNIRPGYQVTFKVRTFRTQEGEETWDFGDGAPPVTVRSDGNARTHDPLGYAETDHRYESPGTYLVKVSRTDAHGQTATARLVVRVE